MNKRRQMPHLSQWKLCLAQTCGPAQATEITLRAEKHFDEFIDQPLPVPNHSLRKQYYEQILPTLALYRSLAEKTPSQEVALVEMEPLFQAAYFTHLSRMIPWLKVFPDPFPVIRVALRWMTRDEYLPGAQEVVEDSPECFAVNVYRCFIVDILAAHNAPELAPLFCKSDDWLAALLPAISWERTKTLAQGGDCCDFRYRRLSKK